MHYRLYNSEDFEPLYAIEEICFKRPFRFGRRYMRKLIEAPHSATWIAEQEGAMTGFAIAEWGMQAAYISTVEVTPNQRRKGIAGELLRRVEQSATEEGAKVMWLHVDSENIEAIHLYKVHGYESVGREEDFYAPGRAALVFRKTLKS